MPLRAEWPVFGEEESHLDFICQIKLRDIASLDPDGVLPHEGLLLFFADIAYYLGWDAEPGISGYVCDRDFVRVIYVPEGEELESKVLIDDDGERVSPEELSMEFSHESGLYDHSLLANPDHREWEDWDSPFEGWKILLQVDSLDNVNFIDEGVLDFIIAPGDLKKRNFANVRAIILST